MDDLNKNKINLTANRIFGYGWTHHVNRETWEGKCRQKDHLFDFMGKRSYYVIQLISHVTCSISLLLSCINFPPSYDVTVFMNHVLQQWFWYVYTPSFGLKMERTHSEHELAFWVPLTIYKSYLRLLLDTYVNREKWEGQCQTII